MFCKAQNCVELDTDKRHILKLNIYLQNVSYWINENIFQDCKPDFSDSSADQNETQREMPVREHSREQGMFRENVLLVFCSTAAEASRLSSM
jgi:hypothetical protein